MKNLTFESKERLHKKIFTITFVLFSVLGLLASMRIKGFDQPVGFSESVWYYIMPIFLSLTLSSFLSEMVKDSLLKSDIAIKVDEDVKVITHDNLKELIANDISRQISVSYIEIIEEKGKSLIVTINGNLISKEEFLPNDIARRIQTSLKSYNDGVFNGYDITLKWNISFEHMVIV